MRAIEVCRKLGLRAVEEIEISSIARHFGLTIRYGGLAGAQGRLAGNGKRGIIRIADSITHEPRRRYIIAHELGHHLIHAPTGQLSLCTDGDLLSYDRSAGNAEEEANWFAAELLMPKPLFEPRCDVRMPSLAHVRELAAAFGTTLTATAIRFVDLAPERCAIVWSKRGAIEWAVRGPDFWPWIDFGRKLDHETNAYDAFQGKALPTCPERVPARAWSSQIDGDLYEDSAWFSALNVTLSLLWLPADDEP